MAAVSSGDVNDALHHLASPGASAKDFRTWGATVRVAGHLAGAGAPAAGGADRAVLDAVDEAAEALGNTRAVCRSCYVHPAVPEAFRSGALARHWAQARAGRWLTRPERAVLSLLQAAGERAA